MTWFKVELIAPPSHFPLPVMEYVRFLTERSNWCNKHAGEFGVSWEEKPISGDMRLREYSFKDSKIATWFALRWS
jgi:hypothetical protein